MMTIEGLRAGYGRLEAIHGIDLNINEGEIVGLIGANGVGKSTLLRAVSGIVKPTAGTIVYADRDIAGLAPHAILRAGVSHCPENRRVWPKMTVRENLDLGGWSVGSRRHVAAESQRMLDLFPKLAQRLGQLAGTLSGGEQQMLAVARALMSRPKILLLDEPTLGLSPIMVQEIIRLVEQVRLEGVAVLLVEQNAAFALKLADRGCVMEGGQISYSGSAADLLGDETVRRTYLGVA